MASLEEVFWALSPYLVEVEEEQVSMLQYCMDKDVNDILTSTNITTEERQQYQSVIA